MACSVIVAALGGVGWAVVASATPPSPVIGRPVVVTPEARELPTVEPTESPEPPAESGSPSSTPSRTPSRTPSPSATSPAEPVPSVTHSADDEETPEVVAPRRVRPVEDDDGEGRQDGYENRDDDGSRDGDGVEADDD